MSLSELDKLIISNVIPHFDLGSGRIVGVGTIHGERRVIIQNFGNEYRYINGKFQILPVSDDDLTDFCPVSPSDLEIIGRIVQSKSMMANSQNFPSYSRGGFPALNPNRHSIGVNKIALCLIVFFAGSIGVHLFMDRKIVMGILYLLFCWTGISFIFAIVDLIRIASLSDYEYELKYNYPAK